MEREREGGRGGRDVEGEKADLYGINGGGDIHKAMTLFLVL